jgi:L-threonylcarbamoyladenylate synthase
LKTEFLDASPRSIARACALLDSLEVVALPTETVYGLAGNALKEDSVRKIFSAKSRPYYDPLIVHIGLRYLSDPEGPIPALIRDGILHPSLASSKDRESIEKLSQKFWPGPLTLVLPRGPAISELVSGGHPTVAIRMPVHSMFQSVLQHLDFPLAAPSANRFGRISPTTAEHVRSELEGRIAAIVDGGPCSVGVESSILKIEDGRASLLRPGGIPVSDIKACIGFSIRTGVTPGSKPEAPGMLDEHYAPRKPLILIPEPVNTYPDLGKVLREVGSSDRIGLLSHAPVPGSFDLKRFCAHRTLSDTGDSMDAARNLFALLRELDQDPFVDLILADLPLDNSGGIYAAIADRLHRASRNKPLS